MILTSAFRHFFRVCAVGDRGQVAGLLASARPGQVEAEAGPSKVASATRARASKRPKPSKAELGPS